MKKIGIFWQLAASDKSWRTISNGITIIRLLLAPVVVVSLYRQWWMVAATVFTVAAVTDLLDGYVARAFDQQTHLGTLLDPLADKCLLVASFGALAFFRSPFFHIPHWFFVIVACRELLILFGSIILLLWYKDAHIQPMVWGKLTTFLQILFIMWVFVCYFADWEPKRTYMFLLVLLAIFSLLSLCQYIKRAVSDVRPT